MAPNFTIGNFLGYAFGVLYMSIRVTEDCLLVFFTTFNHAFYKVTIYRHTKLDEKPSQTNVIVFQECFN